ncbi:hypothetical protein Pla111_08300 [Botrimarina hoheduenensis]|uniref:Uncharacterized protein n=1 Tax=Botrimarina hoheduenensis TaxID=2528000 RepID=A0A5C5W8J9_9BACT|nr:hypothetical protein Pla111_08300 [Botrimarina hoheduenensis]
MGWNTIRYCLVPSGYALAPECGGSVDTSVPTKHPRVFDVVRSSNAKASVVSRVSLVQTLRMHGLNATVVKGGYVCYSCDGVDVSIYCDGVAVRSVDATFLLGKSRPRLDDWVRLLVDLCSSHSLVLFSMQDAQIVDSSSITESFTANPKWAEFEQKLW